MSIVITPIPSTIELAAPAFTLGSTNIAGGAVTAVASNSTLLTFDGVVPGDLAYSQSASVGSAVLPSRRDHGHGMTAGLIQSMADVTSTQTINDSTTFQETTITHTVAANEDWGWQINLLYNSNSTADLKLEWAEIPTGMTGHWSAMGYQANGTIDLQSKVSLAGDLTAGGQGAVYSIFLYGVFIGGSGSDTLELHFAQNTANASNTTIEIGSWGIFTKIR